MGGTFGGFLLTLVLLKDAGSTSLNVWVRRSLRSLRLEEPLDFMVKG
jgi:hypothetical protein